METFCALIQDGVHHIHNLMFKTSQKMKKNKKTAYFLLIILPFVAFGVGTKIVPQKALAQSTTGPFVMADFIAGDDFQPHLLDSGESIRFEATGKGGPSGSKAIRMYKNDNWEQFFINSNGVYRAEDTAWAPRSGFQDAHCLDGNKAIFTLRQGCGPSGNGYTDGQKVLGDGVLWAPRAASVGGTWSTPAPQVVTLNADRIFADEEKVYCSLTDLEGYGGTQVCGQVSTLQLQGYYPASSCPDLDGAEDMIKLQVTGGPGTGDTFCYMKNWGLVAFSAPGFSSNLVGANAPCGCIGETSTEEKGLEPSRKPLDEGFTPLRYACPRTTNNEFHQLRPYPASACDPLIPMSFEAATKVDNNKYITYSCGNSLTPVATEGFDPYGLNGNDSMMRVPDGAGNEYAYAVCDQYGPFGDLTKLECYRTISIDLTVDLKDTNLGVLGNTQMSGLTDAQKVNEYLAYYFTGVPQVTDHVVSLDPEEIERLVNYSGPLRKLLPWDLQNAQARGTIADEGKKTVNIHNYSEGPEDQANPRLSRFANNSPPELADYKSIPEYEKAMTTWRFGESIIPNIPIVGDPIAFVRELFNYQTKWAKLFQNLPLSSLEDTAGEFVLSIFQPEGGKQPAEVVYPPGYTNADGLGTAETKIVIQSTKPAE